MFNIVLYQPEIPPNTGNIIRLCANTGSQLHLIRPLGFELEDKKLRRAGLDYREWASVVEHDTFENFCEQIQPKRIWAVSTRGKRVYSDVQYQPQDTFLFGPETRGLPQTLLENLGQERVIRLPMVAESRSLNLSNSAAVLVYEAWRQQGFSAGG
ncbi:MAG TPA: tRNA (uridine(34)/cytosine(34)/5-carboxymethylaminomethyluridine(34)-2'-O)-methyltransferase TrmL [Gammaproteobacteria bacterium]|nr:tRNA (uridine(34)/cytosine(34)/5-carboxymethylaminomethyluridine(34)-2'-O)-methyltransferase TrmL [Gammaproteobacteria bacterium]